MEMGKHKNRAEQKVGQILKVLRVIIYARVSSQKQLDDKEENSIQSQIRCCEKFCTEMQRAGERWEIVEIISDDGRTGRNDKRDGINRVRELTARGDTDVVLVYGLSRAFRNSRLGHEFDQALDGHGVRLVSTTQPGGNDTPYEKFVRTIFWGMAELTSNIISEDVRRSIQTRLLKGLTHGAVPKPGYEIENGRLYIVPEDAKVVMDIFEMTVNGMMPMEIVNDLKERGIKTRKRISKKGNVTGGKRFRIEHVLTILRDPTYKGVIVHDGVEYPSAAESIVSEEIWNKAQVALDTRPSKKEGILQVRDKNFMPLKGKIRCGCCNSALKPSFSTKRKRDGSMEKYFYYLCSKHEKQGNESTCSVQRIPARLLEKLLLEAFGEIAANPDVAKRLIEKAPKATSSKIRGLSKERQAIRKQLKELDAEVESVTDKILIMAGTVVGEKMKNKIDLLTERKNELVAEEIGLNKEIDALKSDLLAPKKLQNALAHFAEAVKCLPEDEQRELYKLLFKSIIVNEGGKAKDPVNENARRTRGNRRHLSVEVRLRTEAIQTLFGETESTGGRKSGFTLPLEIALCRKKPMKNCAILSPVHKECGHKAPKTRKRPKKTEHEIHRAIRWKKEMEELGLNESKLATKLGISRNGVNEVMKWLRLSKEVQRRLLDLKDSKEIRKYSRRWLKDQLADKGHT
jgi:DNA invertase Pin-like site-specific DNA recombinase